LTGLGAIRLTVLRRIDAGQADAILNLARSQNVDRVAVVDADDPGGEGFLGHRGYGKRENGDRDEDCGTIPLHGHCDSPLYAEN